MRKTRLYLLVIILLVTNTGFAGESWEIHSDRPVIQNHLDTDDFDYKEAEDCSVVKVGNIYHMWYTGNGQPSGENNPSFLSRIGYATSTDGENWIKQNNGNPVISFFTIYQVDGIDFRIDYAHVSRPRVVSIESGFRIYYMKKEYTDGVFIPQTIWTATSTDGINWENHVSLGIETEVFSVMRKSKKAKNSNRPKNGSQIRVEPIRKISDIEAVKDLLKITL